MSYYLLIFFIRMALSKELSREERIAIALDELNYRRLTYRGAEAKYGIPRSTLSDHVLGKVVLGKKPGPPPVLTPEAHGEALLLSSRIELQPVPKRS
jgi:hypothetical protein